MNSVVCTLFENHFHHGFAALTNSLYKNGFRGVIYAGYRGALPDWFVGKENATLAWKGASTHLVAEGLSVHFLPIETNYHFANYKPQFILSLWDGPAKNADAIFYFDPDIVVNCEWNFYEVWAMQGVGVVHEIVSNDMPLSHPIRRQWEKVIEKSNFKTEHLIDSYLNSGFCGVLTQNKIFIQNWAAFIEIGINEYSANKNKIFSGNKTFPFCFLDQDAFNLAAMTCSAPVSEMGPEAMDFIHGGWTMSHAVGSPKPWKKEYLKSAIKGNPPTMADKSFWLNTGYPIKSFSNFHKKFKTFFISVGSFIGRFYQRY